MHEVLTSHPAWQELQGQRDALQAARVAHRKRVDAVMEPYRQKMAVWQGETNMALLKGKPPPPKPPAPDLGADEDAEHLFQREDQRLRAEQRRVLIEIGPEIEEACRERMAALAERDRPHIAALRDTEREIREALAAVRLVREAANDGTRPTLAARTRSSVTVHDWIADGVSVLDPAPIAPQVGPVQTVDEPVGVEAGDGVVQVTPNLRSNLARSPRQPQPPPPRPATI